MGEAATASGPVTPSPPERVFELTCQCSAVRSAGPLPDPASSSREVHDRQAEIQLDPDSCDHCRERRHDLQVTAGRLVALGVFALGAKKTTHTYATSRSQLTRVTRSSSPEDQRARDAGQAHARAHVARAAQPTVGRRAGAGSDHTGARRAVRERSRRAEESRWHRHSLVRRRNWSWWSVHQRRRRS